MSFYFYQKSQICTFVFIECNSASINNEKFSQNSTWLSKTQNLIMVSNLLKWFLKIAPGTTKTSAKVVKTENLKIRYQICL
jgi:hypothetical protein